MSSENCYNSSQLISDLDIISQVLIERYDKNITTTLNDDDEELLNYIYDVLNKIANSQNIRLNEDGFKNFIKKITKYDVTQIGGNGDKRLLYKYDFFAIVMMVASIFLLYISFLKFNELSQSVIGMDISEISNDIKSQIQDAIYKIRELPIEEITFIQYIYNSIQTFSCSIVETQSNRIKNIVIESLSNMIVDFAAVAERTCIPRTEIITEGAYQVSSSILGDFDFGRTFNTLIQSASVLTSPQATSSCITNTALALQRRAFDEMFHQRTLILNQLTSQTSQAINFLYYGVTFGTPSALYLIYRTKNVLGVAYTQFNTRPSIQNSRELRPFRVTEKGGSRKKYTRKNIKHRKTYRKYKKYRKTYRKHKKPRKL